MRTVALDLGVRKIVLCEVHNGEVVHRKTARSLSELDDFLGAKTLRARVAFESCREAWHVHDRLIALGHEPVLIDTTRVRQIGVGQHGRKNDSLDAEALARALEQGRVPRAHVLSPARRQLRAELSARSTLVTTRAQYVTTVRGLARSEGVLLPSCETTSFVARARAASLSPAMTSVIAPMLLVLDTVGAQIEEVETRLETLARSEPVIALLATVPGVGLIIASTFVSALDEAGRFRDGHSVGSYLGLAPSENTTGMAGRRIGSITKQGNPWARVALVQAAHTILRVASEEDPLRLWAEALIARRGKMIAVVALARRLAGVLWAMWRDDRPYDAARLSARSAEGLTDAAAVTQAQADRLATIATAERKIYLRTTPRKPRSASRRKSAEVPHRG
jgi:transposase